MTFAAIDIGTNTVLLLIASVDETGSITPLAYEQRVPRLGRGVDAQRLLQTDAVRRTVAVVAEYAALCQRFQVESVTVSGTSAVRDAANAADLAREIHSATGYFLEVLSGSDEAILTFRGAVSGIPGFSTAAVIDIGGGSTELTVGTGSVIKEHLSLDIGSVRLTERFLLHDPPLQTELDQARDLVRDRLHPARSFKQREIRSIGVAGTATALAVLAKGMQTFRAEDASNTQLHRHEVDGLFEKMARMPSPEIRSLSEVLEGRADIITAGTLILQEVMTALGCDEITVSERGLRYGLVLREWERYRRNPSTEIRDQNSEEG